VTWSIRQATEADLAPVIRLSGQTLADHQTRQPDQFFDPANKALREWFEAAVHAPDIPGAADSLASLLIAEKDGTFAGHLLLVQYSAPHADGSMDRVAHVYDLSILPRFRRQGVGAALLAAARTLATAAEATVLRATIWAGNDASAGLFTAGGLLPEFTQHGQRLAPALPGPRAEDTARATQDSFLSDPRTRANLAATIAILMALGWLISSLAG
jgi:ribosomal protein S18 acetylase RimI-like enzyme